MLDQSIFRAFDEKAGRPDGLSLTWPGSHLNCLPRSHAFVRDMRAFFEKNGVKADGIAVRQLHAS